MNTKSKLSDLEKRILQNIANQYRYIARDKDGSLFAYEFKPYRGETCWIGSGDVKDIPFTNLFQFIIWECTEPHKIKDLLKEE